MSLRGAWMTRSESKECNIKGGFAGQPETKGGGKTKLRENGRIKRILKLYSFTREEKRGNTSQRTNEWFFNTQEEKKLHQKISVCNGKETNPKDKRPKLGRKSNNKM